MEELEKTVAEQAKALEEKDVIIASLVKENSEFKAKLAVYENPHTPPSAQRVKKKPKQKPGKKKRGAPKGHRGATRPTPKPGKYVGVFTDQCDKCCSNNLEEIDVNPVVIEDLIHHLQQIKATPQ